MMIPVLALLNQIISFLNSRKNWKKKHAIPLLDIIRSNKTIQTHIKLAIELVTFTTEKKILSPEISSAHPAPAACAMSLGDLFYWVVSHDHPIIHHC